MENKVKRKKDKIRVIEVKEASVVHFDKEQEDNLSMLKWNAYDLYEAWKKKRKRSK